MSRRSKRLERGQRALAERLELMHGQVEGIVEVLARIGAAVGVLAARARPSESSPEAELVGDTDEAEVRLFAGWAKRAEALPDTDNVREDLSEGGARMRLIHELHASVACRHPLGIAETIYHAITALHVGDDDDAAQLLEGEADAYRRSIRLEREAAEEREGDSCEPV